MARSKAIATTGEVGALTERPEWASKPSNRGSETVTMDDVAIPRIDVIQDLSPQRKSSKPEYIEGAETGAIFNTVTNQLYGERVHIVPVVFRKEYVIWKDRDSGGGFRGAYRTQEDANHALRQLEDADSCEVVDTAQHFVLVLTSDNRVEEAVMSMSRSKMKASRKLNSLVRQVGGDRFAAVYQVRSVEAVSPKGEYMNFDVAFAGYTPEAVFARAEAMYEAVMTGDRDVDRTDRRDTEEDSEY